ncbi:MAG: patatin-like phospholipase family protein [Gemmatimonadales bacterium]
MLRPLRLGLALALFSGSALRGPSLYAQTCQPPRTALVLSGGGAKGIAHIGVLRVLDSLGIRPDLVVGTSMGAMVGALYASGYTGRELDSLARVTPLADLFRAYQPLAPRSLGILQPLVVWEQGERHFALQSASLVEAEVNALVNAAMLRGNLRARGDFDSLPIPFRAVATDLARHDVVVLRSGDLAQAVRASAAVPLVFAPEPLGGRYLTDGGLSANIPIAVARAEGAQRVIVSDATEHTTDSLTSYSPIVVADRLLQFLFHQTADSLGPLDVMIRPAVDGFPSLNFSHGNLQRLLQLGFAAADSTLPRLACRGAPMRSSSSSLPHHIARVRVPGTNESERLALIRLLGLGLSDSLDSQLLLTRVRTLSAASESYQSVWLNPTGLGDSIEFTLALRRAARRVAGLGIAYDNELGGRMWAGMVDRRFLGRAVEASGALFLGELRRELLVGFRRNFQLARQLVSPALILRLANEDVRRFDADGDELSQAFTREAIGFAGVERALPGGWEVALGIEGHAWRQPGLSDRATLGALGRVVRASRSRGKVFQTELQWTGLYQRAALETQLEGRLGVVRVLPRVRLGWGDDLPLQAGFPLGGDDGFPGLHLGERRGDRETMLGLMLSFPLKGPLLARVEFAGGRTANGGSLFGSDGWVGGVRAGIGAETPLGPLRFEYGRATGDREALFVRLGRWF